MALPDISLAEFNRIASGEHNAGQIDFETDRNGGVSLVKVNNHIHQSSKNNVTLDRQRILDVKEAFIAALERGGVKADSIKEIRANLGLPVDFSASEDAAAVEKLMENRFKPLSRDTVRTVLDTYAKQGRGFNQDPGNENSLYAVENAYATAHMSAGNAKKRDALNAANAAKAKDAVTDVATAGVACGPAGQRLHPGRRPDGQIHGRKKPRFNTSKQIFRNYGIIFAVFTCAC